MRHTEGEAGHTKGARAVGREERSRRADLEQSQYNESGGGHFRQGAARAKARRLKSVK